MKRTLAILLLLAAAPALGQEPETTCGLTETYGDCINRLLGSEQESSKIAADAAAEAAASQAAEEISEKAVPEGAPGAAGAIRDFLPLFFSSLGLGGVTEADNALTLTFNPGFLQMGPDNPLSIQAIVRQPVVFDALVQAIPEEIRADRKSAFEDQLKDFDDMELSLAWSRESERFGRDAGNHRQLLSSVFLKLTQTAAASVGTSASRDLLRKLLDPNLPAEIRNKTPEELEPRVRAELDQFFAAAVQEIAARQKALLALAAKRRFFDLDDLVNNQPQIFVSANYERRNDFVGPDAKRARATFEMGFANVNGLRKHCRRQGKTAPDDNCLTSYLQRYGQTLETSPRLRIEADYSQADSYLFRLPEDDFTYSLDQTKTLTGRATLGGYLRAVQGVQTTRADLEAVYEDVSGDEKRNNRFVATLTFTQKLNGDLSTTLSAVWANKPQYRGEVDQEVSARFGLKYKIDRQTP